MGSMNCLHCEVVALNAFMPDWQCQLVYLEFTSSSLYQKMYGPIHSSGDLRLVAVGMNVIAD